MNQKKTLIFAFGKRTKYAPKTPAMAPEAPIIGVMELVSNKACESAANPPVNR